MFKIKKENLIILQTLNSVELSIHCITTVQTATFLSLGLHPTAFYFEWMRLKSQLTFLKIKACDRPWLETPQRNCGKTQLTGRH